MSRILRGLTSRRPSRITAAAVVLGLVAGHTLGGCATEVRKVPPLDKTDRSNVGALLVTLEPLQPPAGFGPLPKSGSAWGAASAAGYTVLGGAAAGAHGGPYGLIIGGGLGVVLAPFAAIVGAVTTPDIVQPETIAANANLIVAIRDGDWTIKLQQTIGAKLSSLGKSNASELDRSKASRLVLWLEGPWLVLDGSDAIPTLTVHGELLLGDKCALDRRWRWNGTSDDFDDLGEEKAKAYRIQMVSGVSQLGNAIVSDIFLEEAARKVAYKDSKGLLPLAITEPDDYQGTLVSWDKTTVEGSQRSRCSSALRLTEYLRRPPQNDVEEGHTRILP